MSETSSVDVLPLEQCMSAIIDYRGKSPRKTVAGIPLITAKIVKRGRIQTPDEFVDPAEYDTWMRRGLPEVGDVVITTEAPLGEVAQLSDNRIALAQRLILLRGKPGLLDNNYLKYLMMSADVQAQLRSRAFGTTVVGIKQSELRKIELRLPSLGEQRAIADVLGALDSKIEQNRRSAQAIESVARTVFKAWFVDFEPTKAKSSGSVDFASMPRQLFASVPSRLVQSGVGPVAEGWTVKSIGEVVTLKGGGTPSTKVATYWNGGTHCWATPKDLASLEFPILVDTERHITDAGVDQISSGILPADTVLLSSRAPIGYTALAKVPTAINQGFIALVCNGPLSPLYVLQWVHASLEQIKSRASGTTFPEISEAGFRPMHVVVPPSTFVSAFDDLCRPLFDALTSNVRETTKLAALRDYLLPRLFSNQVRVRL
jgi:type I restriction enzyme S subunit